MQISLPERDGEDFDGAVDSGSTPIFFNKPPPKKEPEIRTKAPLIDPRRRRRRRGARTIFGISRLVHWKRGVYRTRPPAVFASRSRNARPFRLTTHGGVCTTPAPTPLPQTNPKRNFATRRCPNYSRRCTIQLTERNESHCNDAT